MTNTGSQASTNVPDEHVEDGVSDRQIKVVRDASFARRSADNALFFNLGHDVEMSFLYSEPRPILLMKNEGESESEGYRLQPTLTEVAKIRMPPDAAIRFALNVVARMVSDGVVDDQAIRESFDEILQMIPKDSPDVQDGLSGSDS